MVTRLVPETALSGRVDGLFHLIYREIRSARGLDSLDIAPTGSNPIYNDPLGWAADVLGATPADPSLVTDDDLARVVASSYYTFLDLAEYRAIASALNGFVLPDETAKDRQQAWSAMANRFATRLKDLAGMLAPILTTTRYTLGTGSIGLPISTPRWGCGEYGVPDRPWCGD